MPTSGDLGGDRLGKLGVALQDSIFNLVWLRYIAFKKNIVQSN